MIEREYLEDLRDEIVEAFDELAVDEARDYCPECGRQALGRVCAGCGHAMAGSGFPFRGSGVTPFVGGVSLRGRGWHRDGACCRPNPPDGARLPMVLAARFLLVVSYPVRFYAWKTAR